MAALLVTIGRLRAGGEAALGRYAAGVIPLIAAAGGEVITRAHPTETVVGKHPDGERPDLVAVMRFPDAESIRTFLTSDSYQVYRPHRDEAFAEIHSYVAADLMKQ